MIVFLIGFMGSGKSTTGKELAKRLNYGYADTDSIIVDKFGMSINEIFDRLGETRFRESEVRVLNDLVTRKNIVVSTGGGLPCHGRNMDIINRHGVSVYLKASPEELTERLSSRKQKRPLIKDLSDEELFKFIKDKLEEREPFYGKARYIVDGIKTDIRDLTDRLES